MSRINTNVSSLIAQRTLSQNAKGVNTSLERLSTGFRINRGADDPAGLIASENLRSDKAAIDAAIGNAQRAEQVVNIAEGGLQEISTLLVELKTLVGATANDAGYSTKEKEANQLQIDSILQTIDRVAGATSFQGVKLLNGTFDYTTSGVSSTLVNDVSVKSARLADTPGASLTVTVDVTQSAQTGEIYISTGSSLVNGGNGSISFEITGGDGVQQFTFASGTSQASIITAINTFSSALGVSAIQNTTDTARVELRSTTFGTDNFVRAKILEGTASNLIAASASAATSATDLKDYGRDATVTINGNAATVAGTSARVATDGLDLTVDIAGTSALNRDNGTETFYITGGGADFNLAPQVSLASKVSIGIQTVTTGNLGDSVNGFLSALKTGGTANVVDGNLSTAQKIIDNSIEQVAGLRGRLGAFTQFTVGSTIRNLGVTFENTAAAESEIRDLDFANETAELTRQQIIAQAATRSLSIANAQPQQVLGLIG